MRAGRMQGKNTEKVAKVQDECLNAVQAQEP